MDGQMNGRVDGRM